VTKISIDERRHRQNGVEFMAKVKPAPRRGLRKASARGKSKRKMSGKPSGKAAGSAVASPSEVASEMPSDLAAEDQIIASNLSLHQLFEQQARQMIERADLDEEQKQTILVAMSCPCCGAGAMAFTAKLRR
jgi:hypothetical protein